MFSQKAQYDQKVQECQSLRTQLAQAPVAKPPPDSVLFDTAKTISLPSPVGLGGGGIGSMAPILKFNGYGVRSWLLYYSPHSVLYDDELYPTAIHLFEARKFLDHRPDLADRIRKCESPQDVTALSAKLEDFVRRDWGNVALATVSINFVSSHPCVGWATYADRDVWGWLHRWTRFYISSFASMATCALCFSTLSLPIFSMSSLKTRSGETVRAMAGTSSANLSCACASGLAANYTGNSYLSSSSLFTGTSIRSGYSDSGLLEEIGTRGGKRVGLTGEGSGQTRKGAREVQSNLS